MVHVGTSSGLHPAAHPRYQCCQVTLRVHALQQLCGARGRRVVSPFRQNTHELGIRPFERTTGRTSLRAKRVRAGAGVLRAVVGSQLGALGQVPGLAECVDLRRRRIFGSTRGGETDPPEAVVLENTVLDGLYIVAAMALTLPSREHRAIGQNSLRGLPGACRASLEPLIGAGWVRLRWR